MGTKYLRLLSLDLGITTGFATWDGAELSEHGVVPDYFLRQWCYEMSEREWDAVIGEEPIYIRGPLGESLQDVTRVVKNFFPDIRMFSASQWKNTKYRNAEVPPKISIHARDAIRFGTWFQNRS